MFKNTASQKFRVFAFDSTTNLPKSGDAANITAYISKDYGAVTVLGDTSATEEDATNAKGWYLFDATQAETNFDEGNLTGKSSTANIVVIGQRIATVPPLFTTLAISAAGRTDIGLILGTAISTPATAGILDVNVKNMNNVAATPITTIKAVQGLTTADTIATYTGNTKQTGDVYAALPANFSAMVIDATGRVNAFLIGILTSVFTEGATGRIAAAFKQFFNIASPAATMDHGVLVDTVTTATNLTNAPTAGDLTAAMKTSVTTAATAATPTAAAVTARVTANTDQLAGQTVTAAAGVTFPATVASPTGNRLSATGVNDVLRTPLTEGYAADGAAFTLEQLGYMLWSALQEFSISGTTITAKQLDGSTAAMTWTLDSATIPTSRTRAT